MSDKGTKDTTNKFNMESEGYDALAHLKDMNKEADRAIERTQRENEETRQFLKERGLDV
ncbi:MAG: hypothetical protein H6867_07725 [Rhodospirillales bacterium]|nr:hypothetical protein [Rhodospirillales bacterium]MCB9995441.1 hypothetical protein [Rhodospirillales bacterium]